MHAASRDALHQVSRVLDTQTESTDSAVASAQLGTDIFDAVEALDADRALRTAVADTSRTATQRSGLITQILENRVGQPALEILQAAATHVWSTPREFRTGLVALGRRALLRGAQAEGQLEAVEKQLYDLRNILAAEPQLSMLLSDPKARKDQRRGLLANVLYGKALKYTEALALQVIGRPEHNPVDDIGNLVDLAAELRGRTVANVTSAVELSPQQHDALEAKLSRIYGKDIAVHSRVDESILGGLIIRVGDEKIDGSTIGRLQDLRAQLV